MELRSSFLVSAAVKSLVDVVLPAIDPANALAQEQGKLAVGTLQFAASRMSLQFRYDAVDLSQLVELAGTIRDVLRSEANADEAASALDTVTRRSESVLSRALVDPAALEDAGAELRGAITSAMSAARASKSVPAQRSIAKAVVKHAGEQLARERAWVAPQGWEGDVSIPAIDTLLGQSEIAPTSASS